jgi:hypothetical protein
MVLLNTKVYVFDQQFKDVGLSNIRKIKCINDLYFAISYDNDLFAWGKNHCNRLSLDEEFIEKPRLIMKSVKRIYAEYYWLGIINCNHELFILGFFLDLSRLPKNNIKKQVSTINGIDILTCNNEFISRNGVINNVRYANLYYMIMNDNMLIYENHLGKQILNNVKYAKQNDLHFYILTIDNVLYRTYSCRVKLCYEHLEKLEDNVEYFKLSYTKCAFVKIDKKRIVYDGDKRLEVDYDVYFGKDCRMIVENDRIKFDGKFEGVEF